MSSGSGLEAARRRDEVLAGSFVESGSSVSGSGTSIHILKWSDCDTVGKMAGFIIGKGLQYGGRVIKNAVQLFYLDKTSECFFRFVRWSFTNTCDCCERINQFASTYIIPIFVNDCTKWAWNTTCDNLLSPAGRLIRTVAKLIFQTILWESVCVPLWKRVIKPIAQKLCPGLPSQAVRIESVRSWRLPEWFAKGLKTLADWTIVPFCNYVLSPFFSSLSDFFCGVFSGTLGTKAEERVEDEESVPETTGELLKKRLENIDTEYPVLYQFLTSDPTFTLSEEVNLRFEEAFGDEHILDPARDRAFLKDLNSNYKPEISYIQKQEAEDYEDESDWLFALVNKTEVRDVNIDRTLSNYAKARPDLQISAFLREVILYAIGIR